MSGSTEKSAAVLPAARPRAERWRSLPGGFRDARLCYDHLAGVLGVGITRALVEQEALVEQGSPVEQAASGAGSPGGHRRASHQWWQLGPNAEPVFSALGVDLAAVRHRPTRRPLLRACLDWTEQEPHLAGHLGATLATALLTQGWITRQPAGRAVDLTARGRRMLSQLGTVR